MPAAAPTGRDAEALRSLARRIDPSDPGAQNNLGVFYYERGMVPEAIAAFRRALALDPEMRVAQDNLETVQRESGYYDARIGELRALLSREPNGRAARLELGRAYLPPGHPRGVRGGGGSGSRQLGGAPLPRPGAVQSGAQRPGALRPHRSERAQPRSRRGAPRARVRV